MFPATAQRVALNTADHVNREIQESMEGNVARYARRGRDAIDARLQQLDREWDIERTLEANAASVFLASVALGTLVDKRFFALSAAVGGFLLLHAVQGWCPPVPLFRRLGVRTQAEIDQEKYALKALRGDFREVRPPSEGDGEAEIQQAVRAAR
jgi:hypothetical protein